VLIIEYCKWCYNRFQHVATGTSYSSLL
jgi:hypothetical protein